MPPRLELRGQRFGRLMVVQRTRQDSFGAWKWQCRCDCGAVTEVRGAQLTAGRSHACSSCATSLANTTHGMTGTPLYRRWRAMVERTGNPQSSDYRNYGGRGIAVCGRWRGFEAFAEDMGPTFDKRLELDRIDVNGEYSPENCRWATRIEQQRNRRNNHRIEWCGLNLTVEEWGERLGLKPNTITTRIRRGWSIERALTKDVLLEWANASPSEVNRGDT